MLLENEQSEIYKLDLAITFVLWLAIMAAALYLLPVSSHEIISTLVYMVLLLGISSASLIFYIKKNKPNYRHIAEVSFIVFFIGYFLFTMLEVYLMGMTDYLIVLLLLILISILSSPILVYIVKIKGSGQKTITGAVAALLMIYLLATGLISIFILWAIIGVVLAGIFALCGILWTFLFKLVGSIFSK